MRKNERAEIDEGDSRTPLSNIVWGLFFVGEGNQQCNNAGVPERCTENNNYAAGKRKNDKVNVFKA